MIPYCRTPAAIKQHPPPPPFLGGWILFEKADGNF